MTVSLDSFKKCNDQCIMSSIVLICSSFYTTSRRCQSIKTRLYWWLEKSPSESKKSKFIIWKPMWNMTISCLIYKLTFDYFVLFNFLYLSNQSSINWLTSAGLGPLRCLATSTPPSVTQQSNHSRNNRSSLSNFGENKTNENVINHPSHSANSPFKSPVYRVQQNWGDGLISCSILPPTPTHHCSGSPMWEPKNFKWHITEVKKNEHFLKIINIPHRVDDWKLKGEKARTMK